MIYVTMKTYLHKCAKVLKFNISTRLRDLLKLFCIIYLKYFKVAKNEINFSKKLKPLFRNFLMYIITICRPRFVYKFKIIRYLIGVYSIVLNTKKQTGLITSIFSSKHTEFKVITT